MTAHPTEATRRAMLDIHKRIADEMMQLDNPTLTHREREATREKAAERSVDSVANRRVARPQADGAR